MTLNPPKGTGYFWWTNGGEHTPTILRVERNHYTKKLYADNGEYSFEVKNKPEIGNNDDGLWEEEDFAFIHEGKKYLYGTQLWSENPIELPEIDGEFVKIDSF